MRVRPSGGFKPSSHRRAPLRTTRLKGVLRSQNRHVTTVVLLVPIFVLLLLLTLWSKAIHQDVGTKPNYQAPPPARFSLSATGISWSRHPVYCLTNRSGQVLSHVTLMSWSEQDVPILYVGTSTPDNLSAYSPISASDIQLKPGESLWLAASLQKPYKLTVFWRTNSRAVVYQIYTLNN